MKKSFVLIIVVLISLFLMISSSLNSNPQSKDHFFETVLDKTISSSTAGKTVDLSGFKEYSVLARFQGQPNGTFALEFGHNNITVIREELKLNAQGWLNLAKVYPVYAPRVGCAVYNPPPNTKVKIMIYAGH